MTTCVIIVGNDSKMLDPFQSTFIGLIQKVAVFRKIRLGFVTEKLLHLSYIRKVTYLDIGRHSDWPNWRLSGFTESRQQFQDSASKYVTTIFYHTFHQIYYLHFVYKQMLRWFPSFQVATTCLSCSPPDLNFLVICFFLSIFVYM